MTRKEARSSDDHRATPYEYLVSLVQLALLVLAMQWFNIENQAFSETIMPLALAGFFINHFLPQRHRLAFFTVLSCLGIVLVFGIGDGFWLIAVCLFMIGLCHLPLSLAWRIVLLILAGALLAWLRTGAGWTPWSNAIWTIAGSILMFRLIVYMVQIRHQKSAAGTWQTLGYFFLLPNSVFPLFPVVDYNTYLRTYYNTREFTIYQRGIKYLFWGMVHLLLYRYINYNWTLSPEDVTDTSLLMQFVLSNFFLYLRVSGQFHIIVGILHLFGFNLPLTHHLYYLASSFTDFWRRINIYWKDFMLNVFFNPSYFVLRKFGDTAALVLSTAVVFFLTWFLHAYQWFWLRGSFLLALHDALFWVILGVLVIANVLIETRYGRRRSLSRKKPTGREVAVLTGKRIATFLFIAGLWSFWTSASVGDWWTMVRNAFGDSPPGPTQALLSWVVFLVATIAIIGGWTVYLERISAASKPGMDRTNDSKFRHAATVAVLAAIALLGSGKADHLLPDSLYAATRDVRQAKLGIRDARLLDQGYYENLIGVNRFNSELWELYSRKPADWKNLNETPAITFTDDLAGEILAPNVNMVFKQAAFTTNSHGMRDREYPQTAGADTYRIAVLGDSRSMGSGVADEETFENLMEARWNSETSPDASPVEILNFSVAGYASVQNLYTLANKALAFQPDRIVLVSGPGELRWTASHLANRVAAGADIPEFYQATLNAAGVTADQPIAVIERRLQPVADELVRLTYEHIAEISAQAGADVVWVYLPVIGNRGYSVPLVELASAAGFHTIDLSDVFDGMPAESLVLADWDSHPNATAHAIIADALLPRLQAIKTSPPSR